MLLLGKKILKTKIIDIVENIVNFYSMHFLFYAEALDEVMKLEYLKF